ncbi:MAG TPA: metallophosphoesterase [Vicinamibacterales bacterium]|nr:metallophosphoesterase [Vicinamibacterales bacterium]
MSLVYWISDGVGAGVDDKGGPDGRTPIATAILRWIRTRGSPALIVNGGDVYPDGKTKDFAAFFDQMDRDVSLMCQTPGNHDWRDDAEMAGTGRIPHGYETFWHGHPESKQPVDSSRHGGARYEHFIDLDGWRFIFVDTGDYKKNPWPGGDPARLSWLKNTLQPGRANILLAHHSRLSRGRHGDNDKLDVLWNALFDDSGAPRVALTLSGHDHSVSVYGPRTRDPKVTSADQKTGIHVFVNGAGGNGHYSGNGLFGLFGGAGTKPDIYFDDDHYCVTRINLIDATSVDVDVLDFGSSAKRDPVAVAKSLVQIRL